MTEAKPRFELDHKVQVVVFKVDLAKRPARIHQQSEVLDDEWTAVSTAHEEETFFDRSFLPEFAEDCGEYFRP